MHTPEHLVSQTASVTTGILAAGVLVLAATRARSELVSPNPDGTTVDVRSRVAMAASVTGAIFAAQMLNVPIASGTSGHVLGSALAAVLLGPWLGLLCVSLVLVVQALVFADGGLTALGVNVTLMGVVGVGAAWAVVRALLSRRTVAGSVPRAAAVGGLLSVPAAALAFTAVYAVGGPVAVPLGTLAGQMLGWHLLIGLGEAVLTGAVVAAVMVVDPALVFAARRFSTPERARHSTWAGVVSVACGAGLAVLVLARFASPQPDGLAFVSQDLGLDVAVGTHALAGSWLAGYGAARGLDVGLVGLVGVVLTGVAAFGLVGLLARSQPPVSTPIAISPAMDN